MTQQNIQSSMEDWYPEALYPKFLLLLSFVEMWERFSYYGMRALLIIYLTTVLGVSDTDALNVYALFLSFSYFGCVLFGYLADNMLNPRYVMVSGGIMMTLGNALMAFSVYYTEIFYLGLTFVTIGASAFKGNISNLLGMCYIEHKAENQRDNGYILFYVAVNVGALLSSLACGAIKQAYNANFGFGLSALGIFIGLITFVFNVSKILKEVGNSEIKSKNKILFWAIMFVYTIIVSYGMKSPSHLLGIVKYASVLVIIYYFYLVTLLNNDGQKNMLLLLIYLIFYILFYALEFQIAGFLLLFTNRNVDLTLFGYQITAEHTQSINPFTIMIFGLVLSYVMRFYTETKVENRGMMNFILGLSATPICFVILYVGTLYHVNHVVPIIYLILGITIMSIGELFIGPFIQSQTSALAPSDMRGVMFGITMFALSYANIVGAFVAQYFAVDVKDVDNKATSLLVYQEGFLWITKISLIVLSIFIIINTLFVKYYFVRKQKQIDA